MLTRLESHHLGPVDSLALDLASRLNVFTGDNGLGKTFVLELAWHLLTGTWTASPLLPTVLAKDSTLEGASGEERIQHNGLRVPPVVVFAHVDGGFSVFDPVRNDRRRGGTGQNHHILSSAIQGTTAGIRPAIERFHFTPDEVWTGLKSDGEVYSKGLIDDVLEWQLVDGSSPAPGPFKLLTRALEQLSSSPAETLRIGEPVKLSARDARRYPTLRFPYGVVPVVHASAGIRRILALAYMLVWALFEHRAACAFSGVQPATSLVLLIDEVESHLHPQWQRRIVPALLAVMQELAPDTGVQVFFTTHSPLVLASLEPAFDRERDALWMFDLTNTGEVHVTKDAWHRRGDASAWLRSEVFDLGEARSEEAEKALGEARAFMAADVPERVGFDAIYLALRKSLPGADPFWVQWRGWAWKHRLLDEQAP